MTEFLTVTTTPPPRLVLIGMMASGKTRVGRLVAAHLGWALWDNDEELLATAGRDAHAIFTSDGPEAVHRLEERVLRRALEQPRSQVICAPASAVLSPTCIALLEREWVVWLRATPQTLAQRVTGDATPRPYLQETPLATLTALAAARDPGFATVADCTIDVDDLTAEDAAHQVVTQLPATLRDARVPQHSVELAPPPKAQRQ